MMKYSFSKLGWSLAACLLLAGSVFGQARIATIDLGKVFDNYWKTKQAQGVLKERSADMEKELKNMIDDRRKAKEAYDKIMTDANDPAVSAEEREKRKKSAEEKLKYLREQEETIGQYERQARVTLDEQTRRMRENILSEIRTIVTAKAKAANTTLVIDTAAETINKTPVILFSNDENDLTKDVLKELNATSPVETKLDDKKPTALEKKK